MKSSVVDVPPATPDLKGHIPALDGLRGVAILLVLVYHQTGLIGGRRGVDLFFVLSGFLITGILFDSKGSRGYFSSFYCRRMLRIFPLYYAVLFVSLVVLPRIADEKLAYFSRIQGDEIWYWLYASNFCIAWAGWGQGFLDVSWSLAVEEQFYLIWPVVVYFCSRKLMLNVCAVIIIFCLLLRLWLVAHDVALIHAIYVLSPTRMDALAVEAWVALAARCPDGLGMLSKMARWVLPVTASVIAGLVLTRHFGSVAPVAVPLYIWVEQGPGFTCVAAFAAALLVMAITEPSDSRVGRFFAHPFLRTFGRYSYALYLFHLPVQHLLRETIFGPEQFPTWGGSQIPGRLLFCVAATAISLFASWLSWVCFESHFLKLKRYFSTGPRMRERQEPEKGLQACAELPA